MNTRILTAALLCLLLTSCDSSTTETSTEVVDAASSTETVEKKGIQWYDGSVEQAFADARDAATPVFLYWGAVWCPPCQEIKSTVFKSDSFINLSRQFIPVYLDGDTDRAQSWGEKFGVMGYPTMIVFNPAGEEITRIPGGIDITRYNSVLELSMKQMRPTARLVEYALNDVSRLTADDYYQLAYYSWGQDTSAVPEDADKAAMFYRLSEGTADPELSARFYMWYVSSVADKNVPGENGAEPELPLQPGDDMSARLTGLLESDALTLACWDTLAYYVDEITGLPVFSEEEKAALQSLWGDQLFSLRNHESLSKAEKLAGWLPRLAVETSDDQALPEALATQLRTEMGQVDQDTPDSFERQSVINQMSYIYRQAGLKDDATALLTAELDKSASPYYFMGGLAAYAERDENFEEAVSWRRKAYDNATGEATRFQWGANYVRAMIRMTPAEEEAIMAAANGLLEEFHASDEMFAGRNFRILRRLSKDLATWQSDFDVEEFTFASRVESLCGEQVEDSLERKNCDSLTIKEEAVASAS